MSAGEFMDLCEEHLAPGKKDALESVSLVPDKCDLRGITHSMSEWYSWETNLRNAVVHNADTPDGHECEKNVRQEKDAFSEILKGVQDAFAAADPMKREKALDRMRWDKVDGLESGHQFDFDKLCLYKIKIMILEKWMGREKRKGEDVLSSALNEIYGAEKNIPGNAQEIQQS